MFQALTTLSINSVQLFNMKKKLVQKRNMSTFPGMHENFEMLNLFINKTIDFASSIVFNKEHLEMFSLFISFFISFFYEEEPLNPENLAYILIGVCCGLSILCLIVVAISIGNWFISMTFLWSRASLNQCPLHL